MAKSIRVSELAKQLGVPSKVVMEKCRAEGLGDKVKNPQSAVTFGLAETIKDWFGNGGGTAVESAAAVDTDVKAAVKARKAPARRAKADAEAPPAETEQPADASSTPEQAVAEAATAPQPVAEAPRVDAPAATVPPEVEPPAAEAAEPEPATPLEPVAQEAPVADAEPAEALAEVPPADAPAAEAPPAAEDAAPTVEAVRTDDTPREAVRAAEAPRPAAPRTAGARPTPVEGQPPTTRPTVTIESRQRQLSGEAEGAVPPRMVVPKKAEVRGPKLIRQEAPEHVPTPRARTGPPGARTGLTPNLGTAKPRGGGGVKSTTDEDEATAKKKAASRTLSSRRRGADGRRGEALEKLREFTEADLIERKDRLNAAAASRAGVDAHLRKTERRGTHERAKSVVERGGAIRIEEPITVKSLSAVLGVKGTDIIKRLMRQGLMVTINQGLEADIAESLAMDLGLELEIVQAKSLDDELRERFDMREIEDEDFKPRPPVVTILGHVDHGKTSLLDKIRSANVAAGEHGGITQHIAAFSVPLVRDGKEKRVTFIDTPGHQAFTAMRARGANMTDIVVLVIDASQGIQPQTVESINHAKAAEVPIVVAMNKIDLPDANPERVLGQLAANGLNPVEWGGDTEVVMTSAVKGTGIDSLLEILDIQAELMELTAPAGTPARGVVIEARVDPGLGPVCTVLVQEGTLALGEHMVAGVGYGRIRALHDSYGKQISAAGPSIPVLVSGLSELPNAGDHFFEVDDLDEARAIAGERALIARQKDLAVKNKVSLDSIKAGMQAGDIATINLILKADVQGSIETLNATIDQHNTEEVAVKVIHSQTGAINESDVELASASDAIIIGFNVGPDEKARNLADIRGVEIRTYNVIYEIFDDLKKAMSGKLAPEIKEVYQGTVEVREIFKISRMGNIAGCFVTDGSVLRNSKIRLIRDGRKVTENLNIDSLRRIKEDAREVKQGFECGIKLVNYDDLKIGDKLEAYTRQEIARSL